MSSVADDAALPLNGIKILDLGVILSAPFAARSLQDLGASIVKVEPLDGDPLRGGPAAKGARRYQFVACNRGRRSLAVDLKSDEGRLILLRLVEQADVLIENFRPGVTARLGIEYESLKAKNPRLVHCTIGGFREDSPLAKPPNTDGVVQAFSGLLELTGSGGLPGMPIPMALADQIAGTTATEAIVAALFRRERTGKGTHITLNMFESLMSWMHASAIGRVKLEPPGTWILRTGDDKLILVQPALHFFKGFANVVAARAGTDVLLADERFQTPDSRTSNVQALIPILNEAFLRDTSASWLAALAAAGVPAGSINTLGEALSAPEVEATMVDFDGEEMAIVGSPYSFDGTRAAVATSGPGLGEHNNEILAEAGYSQDEIDNLREKRVVA